MIKPFEQNNKKSIRQNDKRKIVNVEKKQSIEQIVERRHLGVYILYHRFKNCALAKDPLMEMNKLIGIDIKHPSNFFIKFKEKYKFIANQIRIIYSIKNEFQCWLEENKPAGILKDEALNNWQAKELKQIAGLL